MLETLIILGVFVGVVLLNRRGLELGPSVALGALLLGLISSGSLRFLPGALRDTLLSLGTAQLVATVLLINLLGALMRESGQLDRLVDSVQALCPDPRLTLAAIPALVGLLVLPGGAIFSAPLVDRAAMKSGIDGFRAGFANFWFRHVCHLVLPLSQALVIAVKVGNVPLSELVRLQLPILAVGATVGWVLAFRGLPASRSRGGCRRHWGPFLINGAPILLAVLLVVLLRVDASWILLLSVASVFLLNRKKWRELLRALPGGFSLRLLTLVLGVMFFKAVIGASGLVGQMTGSWKHMGIPLPLLLVVIPFLVAVVIGVSYGSIALTLPVFVAGYGGLGLEPRFVMLVYVSSFVGYLISPIHLCLVLNREYFDLDLGQFYRRLLPLSATVMAAMGAVCWIAG
jgi:integral membrane protein (TIGR00529 family)